LNVYSSIRSEAEQGVFYDHLDKSIQVWEARQKGAESTQRTAEGPLRGGEEEEEEEGEEAHKEGRRSGEKKSTLYGICEIGELS
jgi:hypothetical protein